MNLDTKINPSSRALIESHDSSVERGIVKMNTFENIEDVFQAYNAYMFFYNNLKLHGSLNYMTKCFIRIIQVFAWIQKLFLWKNEIYLFILQ